MSKKSKHHKPKGPKNPPQNSPPVETPELNPTEALDTRIPESPKISEVAAVTAVISEQKPIVEKIEKVEKTPVIVNPETPAAVQTPVKPKRNRGNRNKKKHVDGNPQEGNDGKEDISQDTVVEEKVIPKDEVKPNEEIKPKDEVKLPPASDKKEEVVPKVEQGGKKGKNKKGGGQKTDELTQEKLTEKKADVVVDKKCDAQTQIERKPQKDAKVEEKVTSEVKIITEEIASKPDGASDNAPEKNKRGKNKKKANKNEVVEQVLPIADEEIKNFSGKVFLSDTIPRDEIKIVTCERIFPDDEIKKPSSEQIVVSDIISEIKETPKEEQKKDVKPEQKNKKDKKNKDKPVVPASPVIQSQIDIESAVCDPLICSKKCEESDVKKDISKSEENIAKKEISQTDVSAAKREISKSEESVVNKETKGQEKLINKPLTKADVVDDLFPSLATSIEETLQKLIVCESDMKLAEKLFAGDNTAEIKKSASDVKEFISACVKDIKPIQKESTPDKQPIMKDKGKNKDKKSKKSEKQPENLPKPELNVVSDILEQPIKPIDQKAQEKYTEDMLIIPETTQLIMDLQKESSPGRTFTEQLHDISTKASRTDPSHIETKPKGAIRMGSPAARTASPSSCVLSTKESSPGIREALFKPIAGDSSVIKDAPGGINLCTLGIKPADPRKTPSPTVREQLFQPITEGAIDNLACFPKIVKEPSPNRSLLEQFDKRDVSPGKCFAEKARLVDEKLEEKVDSKNIFLQTASSTTKDNKKESSPGRSLREALFHRNISEDKPETPQTVVTPPVGLESCSIKTPISEDIINLLLSDIPPECITSGLRLSKSKSREDIKDSKSPVKEIKDSESPLKEIKDSEAPTKETKSSKSPVKEIKDAELQVIKDVKDSKSPAKDVKDVKSTVKESISPSETESVKAGEKSDKNKKNKSKNQEKQKPDISIITLPTPPEVVQEKTDTQSVEVACKKEGVSKPVEINIDQLIETPAKLEEILLETPKAAKRAKDKKNKNKGHDIMAECGIVVIEPETPRNIEEVKPVVEENTLNDDSIFKKTDDNSIKDDNKNKKTDKPTKQSVNTPVLIERDSKEDFQEVKLENITNVQSSPVKIAPEAAANTFEFIKIPDRGENTGFEEPSQENIKKEGNKPQPKSPGNQSKNWFGPSSTPAKSSKPDYKKEKDKDAKNVISETECPIVTPVDDLKDASKIVGGAMKKDIKHKGKDSKTQESKSKSKVEAAKAASSSDIAMIDDVDEEFVYKYSFRTVFISNACHICKVQLKEDRVVCRFCHLVSYCTEDHRDEDWQSHQTLCYAICTLSHVKAAEHIYGDARALSGQDYRLLRMQAIVSCEKILKRKLCPWEQEVLLYPRICCNASCREWRSKNLKDCELCGQVSYCTNNMTHLPADHSTWCQSYKLYHRLVSHQLHQGRIEPDLPSKIFPEGYVLPDVCAKLFDDLYGNIKEIDDCHYATLTQLSTAPLTALYAYQKTIGAKDAAQPFTKDTLCLHIIGAELQFEADTLSKWECFFLHLTTGIKELRIVFVGPELNSSKLPVDLLSRVRMCSSCRTANRAVKFEFHDGMLYHDFVESSKFSKPDLICAFNPGFHRATGYAGLDTWPDTISASLRLKAPLCVTAYTQYEMPRDLARVKSVFPDVQVKIEPAKNPYASLRPDRNFISDDEMPLIFKNYQMMVVSAI